MLKYSLFIAGLFIFSISFSQNLDIPPENVGGLKELKRVLQSSFCKENIPPERREYGRIILRFIVNSKGKVDSLSFVKVINSDVDSEIARVFPMLQWLPAVVENKNVSAWHLVEFKVNANFYSENELCSSELSPKVFDMDSVNFKPVFHYGEINKWVYSKLEYPDLALKNSIQGTVITRFVIEPNGALSNIGVHKSVGGGCDEEALRVMRMTKWTPGIGENGPVRTQVFYPITFKTGNSNINPIGNGDMNRGQ